MGKKRTIDLDNAEPLRDLPSSGVQVNYKHQTIIASDETCEYALLTGGKICEANIGVVYVQPAAPAYAIEYDETALNSAHLELSEDAPASARAGDTVAFNIANPDDAPHTVTAIVTFGDTEILCPLTPISVSGSEEIVFVMPSDDVTVSFEVD